MKKLMTRVMMMLMNKQQLDNALAKKLREFGIGDDDIATMMAAGMNPAVFSDAVEAIRDVDFRAMRQEASFFAAARAPQRYTFERTEHGVSLLRSEDFAGLVNRFAAPLFGLAPA